MLSHNLILGLIALYFQTSYSLPSVEFPIDAQFPPVAVAGRLFSFTFSPVTFKSKLDLEYSIEGVPAWLQFRASDRSLTGTPALTDVGTLQLELQAIDPEGQATVLVDLTVLRESSISSNQDLLSKQLSQVGTYSAPNTLLLYPETSFNLEIGSNIFETEEGSLIFYATSENHAPLPAWIHFDGDAVRFSGTTPALLTQQSSPQVFDFFLLASHIPRFSQSSIGFHISVTNHLLTFANPIQTFNVSAGEFLSIPSLIEDLRLDTKSISRDEIATISSNQPSWLTLRSSDLSFYGTVPEMIDDTSFYLQVTDQSRNVANVDIRLFTSGSAKNKTQDVYLGIFNVTVGQMFNYTFTDIASEAVDVEVELGPSKTWLSFDWVNASLQGIVPFNAEPGTMNISAIVRQEGRIMKTEYLTLQLKQPPNSTGNDDLGGETTVPSPTSTQSENSIAEPRHGVNRGLLVLVTVLPIILVLATILIACLLIRRSRKRRARNMTTLPATQDGPQNHSSGFVDSSESESQSQTATRFRPTRHAPQISIPWIQNRNSIRSAGIAGRSEETSTTRTSTSWDDMLLQAQNLRGQILDDRSRDHGNLSSIATDTDIHARLDSYPAAPPSVLTDRVNVFQTLSNPASRTRTSGLGHGTSIRSPGLDFRRATLRQVSVSPLSDPSIMSVWLPSGSVNRSVNFRSRVPPNPAKTSSTFGSRRTNSKKTSFSSGSSEHESLERDEPLHMFRHTQGRVASIPFSGSLWEDEEWMAEASTSKSGDWNTQGLPLSTSRVPTESSVGDDLVVHWIEEPSHFGVPMMSNADSMRSEQSQSNSLRFI